MKLSRRAYAKHRGVSETAVRKAIQEGRIELEPNDKIDPEKADAQWDQNTRKRSSSYSSDFGMDTGSSGQSTTYQQARTANEVYKAQTAKLELERLKGTLVDRKQAQDLVFRLARAQRDAWLNWPTRISAEMAAALEIDDVTLFSALNHAVREHLSELGDTECEFSS